MSLIHRDIIENVIICVVVILGALVIALFLVNTDFFEFDSQSFSDNLTSFCNNPQYSKIDSNLRNALCEI